jgi:Na+-transporting methylmalonyl-CoA/oxaloacetate decarboxylase gamma subunit
MKFLHSLSCHMTPRTVFVVAFLCCIVFAHATESQIDPSFDPGSRSLARTWQHVKGSLPHDKIPDNSDKIKDTGSWAKDYGISLAKVVGPGFVIAILSLLGGVIYGIIKFIRCCCCSSSSDDDEEEESSKEDLETPYTACQIWAPTIVYVVCWVFLFTGMIFGLLNNPRFTQGVDSMGDNVILVGTQVQDLGNGLLTTVDVIVDLIPTTITGLEDQFSDVYPLSDQIEGLAGDINDTSSQVSDITAEIGSINAGNISSLASLNAQLAAVNVSSQSIIASVSDLTNQIAVSLLATVNNTIEQLDDKVGEIDDTVDDIRSAAEGIIDKANDLVKKVIKYVNDGKDYDKKRKSAVLALFVLIIITTFVIIVGYVVKIKTIFNVISALSFIFLFLLWLFGSIHFLLGMVLYDACPVVDVAVQGMLPKDSDVGVVLEGCLYEHRSVLDSMNISAYNLTNVFDYKSEFEQFESFSTTFNFTAINEYFDSIQSLYSYNLTAMANNLTVESFGWNQSYIYDAVDRLNQLTTPDYFSLSNYTSADPTKYSQSSQVNQTKYQITDLIAQNKTIYNETATAKQQLLSAQIDMDYLISNLTALQLRYDNIVDEIVALTTTNINNSIALLDDLQNNITAFFALGNCSFVGDAYVEVRTSLCETMQPAIDLLTVAMFLAGFALIPMVILTEVLSYRIPKVRKMTDCLGGGGDDDYDTSTTGGEKGYPMQGRGDGGGYSAALTDSPAPARHSGITATIGAHPMGDNASTASNSPDFGFARKNQVHPANISQQKQLLPPLEGRHK